MCVSMNTVTGPISALVCGTQAALGIGEGGCIKKQISKYFSALLVGSRGD